MCCWERLGTTVPIVPAVAQEMYGQLPSDETAHWARVLDGEEARENAHYAPATRARIYKAVAEATRLWIRNDLDAQVRNPLESQSCSLRVVQMSAEQIVDAQRLSMEIPESCFRTLTRNRQRGDRNVMAQSAVLGFSVLAAHNRHSILRPEINKWMREEIGLNHDLVQEADDVMYEVYQELNLDPSVEQSKAVLLACLPTNVRPPVREREIIEQFLSRLEKGSFSEGAARSARGLGSAQFVEYIEEIRRALPFSLARETEQRRISMVRDAARNVGWEQ